MAFDVHFWLHRVLAEKVKNVGDLLDAIKLLNFQAERFHKMLPETQQEVINDLFSHMKEYGWNKEIEELKTKLANSTN